jgi:hypothetical protein
MFDRTFSRFERSETRIHQQAIQLDVLDHPLQLAPHRTSGFENRHKRNPKPKLLNLDARCAMNGRDGGGDLCGNQPHHGAIDHSAIPTI